MDNKLELSPKAHEIYINIIKPSLLKLEEYRIAQAEEFNKRIEFAKINGLIIFTIIFLMDYLITDGASFLLISGSAFLYWLYVFKPANNYKKVYEQYIEKNFLTLFFKEMYGFNYQGKQGQIAPYLLQESKLLNKYDETKSKNYIAGVLDDIQIEFAELELSQKSKDRFKGAAIVLTYPEEHLNNIVISSAIPIKKLRDVALARDDFNSAYKTYTNDVSDAKNFIDNNVMQQILEFNWLVVNSFGIKDKVKKIQQYSTPAGITRFAPTEYEIKGNKILILIHTTDNLSIESDINKSIYNEEPVAIIERKIEAIYKLSKAFKM